MLVDEANSYLSSQAPWVAHVKLKNKNTALCLRDMHQKILSHFQQVGFADLTFHFDTTPSKSEQPQSVKTRITTNTNQSKKSTTATPARVELQVHTKMTVMDGVGDIEEYFRRAEALKISHLAFTDRHNVHAFPQIEKISARYPKVQPIYGAQISVVDELQPIVYHPTAKLLSRAKYVFLDLETTGLSARYDAIIEVGLVFVDQLSDFLPINNLQKQNFLIKPNQAISAGAEQVSHITVDELAQAPPLAEVLPQVLKLISDRIVVAHNSPFD